MEIITNPDGLDHRNSARRREIEEGRKTPTQQAVEEDGRATPTQLTFEENTPKNIASSETLTSANPLEGSLLETKAAGLSTRSEPEVTETRESNASESSSSADPGSPLELVPDNPDNSSEKHGDIAYENNDVLSQEYEAEVSSCSFCGQVRKPKPLSRTSRYVNRMLTVTLSQVLEEGKVFELGKQHLNTRTQN